MNAFQPTVILRHDYPDGSGHFDWLIGLRPGVAPGEDLDARDVDTFRCTIRPDQLEVGAETIVERLPDHRRIYLNYSGPLEGDKGSVKRLAVGVLPLPDAKPAPWKLEIAWRIDTGGLFRQHLLLEPLHDDSLPPRWRLRRLPDAPRRW